MNLSIMTDDRRLVTTLPILPEDLTWGRGMTHQTVETINAGEILIIGKKKLMELTINSFLPTNKNGVKKYKFAKSNIAAHFVISRLTNWRDSSTPLRVILTDDDGKTELNISMLIESFEQGRDRVSDIPYELKLKQYIDYKL